ncbi:MAG: hypothetical protein E7Z75_00125 [Methanobrevibacter olleyae]|uniref:Uncharacterized protein n=1 Tax=Methanobrevibacter olleyae TaxID=294671 RepID=A0A8T3VJ34_METOL|nr:hypothetical protein [Methanobrevibacter olleyae]
MTSEMKVCPQCYQLYIEKDECPKCGVELKTLDEFAQELDKQLEHRRGLHTLYVDPSYAETAKKETIMTYYNAYMTLLKADHLNREKYLYGLAKTYDIFDKGHDYTYELDYTTFMNIMDRLLEFNPKRQEYLRLKVYYSYHNYRYEDVLKYVDRILEEEDDYEYAFYKEDSLKKIDRGQ